MFSKAISFSARHSSRTVARSLACSCTRQYTTEKTAAPAQKLLTPEQQKLVEIGNLHQAPATARRRINPDELAPIEIEGPTAVCDGHQQPGLGHPREFVRVNYDYPVRCKYCGTKFLRVHHHEHGVAEKHAGKPAPVQEFGANADSTASKSQDSP